MTELKLLLPTYNAHRFPDQVAAGAIPEFTPPNIPVIIYESLGIRIVLGTHDPGDLTKPDIQIERQPHGWAIFLHPLGGSDPSGYVYFLDDGRSFLQPENDLGPTTPIQTLNPREHVPQIDSP